MTLIDEIITLATAPETSVSTALRKCLVLAYDLNNEHLKDWVEHELNGYSHDDQIPEYRKARITAKGNLRGPFGASIGGQPIPSAILEKDHRHWAETVTLMQPVASYEGAKDTATISWPANMVLYYQEKIIDGFGLVQAWQEVPGSLLVSVVEIVRNRVLKFALELRKEAQELDNKPSSVPPERVEAAVINYIFGGTNVIAGTAKDFTQIGNVVIAKGDLTGLTTALKSLDINDSEIAGLQQAIEHDVKERGTPGIGAKAQEWLKKIGEKLGTSGAKIGTAAAQELVKEWLLQYFGLK